MVPSFANVSGGAGAALLLAWATIAPAFAQQPYPNRPIHVLLGFPAGGGADILGRHLVARLQAVSGKTFVLENKPGAGSNIATNLVAKAKPDGYTLLMGTSSSMVGARFFFKEVSFDPLKDFTAIGALLEGTFVLVTGNNTPAKNLAELTTFLKSRPANRFAQSNQLGLLAGEYYKSKAGFAGVAVAYRSAPEAFPDVQNGLIEFMVSDGTSSVKPIQDGKLRAIATTTINRHPAVPEVPTMREQGFADADFSTWWAMFAPAGTGPQIIDVQSKWLSQVFATDETAKFLLNSGNAPLIADGPATAARIAREIERWAPLVKAAGIEPQ